MTIYTLNSVITFGKHRGETVKDVIDDDTRYIEWATDTVDGFELDEAATDYLHETRESLNMSSGWMDTIPLHNDFDDFWL